MYCSISSSTCALRARALSAPITTMTSAAASADRGHDVVAGRPDVAGLDAVDALDPAEQVVVAAHQPAAEAELALGEIVEVMRKARPQRHAEHRHVARGRALVRIGQARGVAEHRAASCRAGAPGPSSGAANCSSEPPRYSPSATAHVVGRFDRQRPDRGVDVDRLAGLEADLGRRLARRVSRNRDLASTSRSAPGPAPRRSGRASSSWSATPESAALSRSTW